MPKPIAREPKKKGTDSSAKKRTRFEAQSLGGSISMKNRRKNGTFRDYQSTAGKARMRKLTAEQRRAFARLGVAARARKRLENAIES